MGLLQQALKLDPAYAIAHAGLAHAFEVRFTRGGFDPADLAAGVRHARAALVHGGDDANALALAALIIVHLAQDYEAATDAISRAIALNGSCALAYSFGAMIHAYIYMNHPIAEEYASRALRLSPFDPDVFQCHMAVAILRLYENRFDEAAASYAKAARSNPRFSWLPAWQAGALALSGRVDEAKASARARADIPVGSRDSIFDYAVGSYYREGGTQPRAADGRGPPFSRLAGLGDQPRRKRRLGPPFEAGVDAGRVSQHLQRGPPLPSCKNRHSSFREIEYVLACLQVGPAELEMIGRASRAYGSESDDKYLEKA